MVFWALFSSVNICIINKNHFSNEFGGRLHTGNRLALVVISVPRTNLQGSQVLLLNKKCCILRSALSIFFLQILSLSNDSEDHLNRSRARHFVSFSILAFPNSLKFVLLLENLWHCHSDAPGFFLCKTSMLSGRGSQHWSLLNGVLPWESYDWDLLSLNFDSNQHLIGHYASTKIFENDIKPAGTH